VKSSYSQEAVSSMKITAQAVSATGSANHKAASSAVVPGGGADGADTTTSIAPGSSAAVPAASATEAQQTQVSRICTSLIACAPEHYIAVVTVSARVHAAFSIHVLHASFRTMLLGTGGSFCIVFVCLCC
jgi:hypothetical protein